MTDDDLVLRSLRDAAGPRLPPGAAERIAAGAWERAAQLRICGAPRILTVRRAGWAAAAAVLVAVGVMAWRGTDAAFAVEGDPVMVRRGGAWVATRRVGMDALVQVLRGRSVLRWIDGGTLRPRPDSVFHVVRSEVAPSEVRMEFERGGGDILGASFVLAARGVTVERHPSAATFGISITLDASDGAPRVQVVSGRAIVSSRESGERLVLGPAERAGLLSISVAGRAASRLARISNWSAAAGTQIARGGFAVVDADLGPVGGITLVGTNTPPDGLVAYEVPAEAVPDALHRVKRVAVFTIAGDHGAFETQPTRYVYEKDATRVEVIVNGHGAVRIDDGSEPRTFPDLAAFRRGAPQLAALFGDAFDR